MAEGMSESAPAPMVVEVAQQVAPAHVVDLAGRSVEVGQDQVEFKSVQTKSTI